MNRKGNLRHKIEDDSYAYLDKALGTVYLVGEITPKSASQFRQHVRTLERLKKTAAILVEINSPGGDIEAGFLVVDTIELCKKPVTTRVTGIAMSMAALILAAGKVREALPNASIMVHEGWYRLNAGYNEMQFEVAECQRMEKQCADYLDARTGKAPGYWAGRYAGKNLYLTPAQALAEGLVDSIQTARPPCESK
jgi:ATP-dependent Clp protease protease subunit